MNFYEITVMSGRLWIQAEDAPHAYQQVHRILGDDAEFKLERITDLQWADAPVEHTGMQAHGGYAPHSHEVRPDHAGVRSQPAKA
jgi:hypothetical protein